jgi:hypothetical protein
MAYIYRFGSQPYLAPTITLSTNPQGTYIFPFGPEYRNSPIAGNPYSPKPPPPLFGPGYNDLLLDSPLWVYYR